MALLSTAKRAPLLLGLALLIALAAFAIQISIRKRLRPRLWSAEELALYNGTDEGLPILLGIIGSVFDVTEGKTHYGPGGGYHHFAGRDASRAFVSGNFTDKVFHMHHTRRMYDAYLKKAASLSKVNSIVDWRKFYMERYIFTGKLVGRYYDNQGNPTKYLKGIESKAKRGAQLIEKQKIEEAKIPSCNSKWSDKDGGEVWCDIGYPRLIKRPGDIALTGKISQRCACFKEEELGRPGLEVYKGCDYLSKSCSV